MLLAYVAGIGPGLELCLVPEKSDKDSVPIPVHMLIDTSAAVLRVGPDEAVTVVIDPTSEEIIISAVPPAVLYLTPNLPTMPGMRAKRLKVLIDRTGGHRVFYDRDRGNWDLWVANKERGQLE